MTRTIALVLACLTACNVAAAPRDGGEIRCPQTPLFAPDRFTVLNIAPFSPGSEDLLAYVNLLLEKEIVSGRIDELSQEYIYRYIDGGVDAAA